MWQPIDTAPEREMLLVANPKIGRLPVVAERRGQRWFMAATYGRELREHEHPTLWMHIPSMEVEPKAQ